MIHHKERNKRVPSFREIRYQEKKDNIIRKASYIFAEKGYQKTTLEEIAAELKLTKGSIYHYFNGKEDILFQSLLRAHSLANESLTQVCAIPDIPPDERLKLAIKRHVDVITQRFVFSSLRQQDLMLHGEMREKIIRERDKFQVMLSNIIKEGMDQGIFRNDNLKIIVLALLGAINWIGFWYSEDGPFNPEMIGEHIAEYLVNGLALKCDSH